MKRAIVTFAVALAIAFVPLRASATLPPPPIVNTNGTSPVAVWLVMGCAATIIWAAWIANVSQNRQLTAAEANLCGLGFLLRVPR